MLDRNLRVTVAGMDLSKFPVSFTCLSVRLVLDAQFKELGQILDRPLRVCLLVDETDLLVALSFFVLITSSTRHIQAFLKEEQGLFELVGFLVFDSDLLIHSDQVLRDFFTDHREFSLLGLLKSGFEVAHRHFFVHDLFVADSETSVSLGFSLAVLELN